MKIGILGSGDVARVLAGGFFSNDHEVMLGTAHPEKLSDWIKSNSGVLISNFSDAAKFGELLVLAVKGLVASDVLQLAGVENLIGKTVIDTTNPIADSPPENGVLKYFTGLDYSLMEHLQREYSRVHFVKAFNSVGNAYMVNPQFDSGKPTMFICGNDETSKEIVTELLEQFGWEVADMGGVESARAIEPLCMLWCIPGFLRNDWSHAFKLIS